MWEVILESFAMVNLPFTILMIAVMLYWLMVIVGAFSIDTLDGDAGGVDGHIDGGADGHLDGDLHGAHDVDIAGKDVHVGGKDVHVGGKDVGHGHGMSAWHGILLFFNVGKVPLTLLISLLAMSMWMVSMMANHYLNPPMTAWIAMPLLVPNVIVSLFVTKFFSLPMKKIFAALDKDYNASPDVIGRLCVVTTTTVSDRLGQASIQSKGAPILMNVIAEDGQVLTRGQEAVVIRLDQQRGVYVIAPADLEK